MAGGKRQATLDTPVSDVAKKQKISKDIKVAVDEGFAAAGMPAARILGCVGTCTHAPIAEASVYIDSSNGTVYDVTLNQVNIGANNNKVRIAIHGHSPASSFLV